jgi:hypothetical protein
MTVETITKLSTVNRNVIFVSTKLVTKNKNTEKSSQKITKRKAIKNFLYVFECLDVMAEEFGRGIGGRFKEISVENRWKVEGIVEKFVDFS